MIKSAIRSMMKSLKKILLQKDKLPWRLTKVTISIGFFLWFRNYFKGDMGLWDTFWDTLLRVDTLYIMAGEALVKFLALVFVFSVKAHVTILSIIPVYGIYYARRLAHSAEKRINEKIAYDESS